MTYPLMYWLHSREPGFHVVDIPDLRRNFKEELWGQVEGGTVRDAGVDTR